ncbi:SET domain-containing protein 4-like [Lineus longissimus]|uniref:SET domain-containing protein 4-like n=1 Tax=Lineus longissimus TaxID=88925 RepID=UPI002B4E0E5C
MPRRKGRTGRRRTRNYLDYEPLATSSESEGHVDTKSLHTKLRRVSERPVSLEHEESFIVLLKWMKKNGFTLKNLRPAVFPGTGRGLLTKAHLRPGDDIISVPSKLLITTHTALNSYVGEAIKKYGFGSEEISPQLILCLFLAYEKRRGNKSFWYPYISSLPASFSTTAFFTDEERQCLPGFLKEKSDIQLNSIKVSYELALLIGAHIEAACKDFAGGLSWEQYLWAWGVVNTRSVYMEQRLHPLLTGVDHYALVPLLDMLNHSVSAKVKAVFSKSTDRYMMQTFDTYRPYDQVFICYGPHDNSKLLLEYGFVLPVNPHNAVTFKEDDFNIIKFQFPESAWKKKRAMMEENDVLCSLCCSADGPSWNLQCVFRILVRDWETRISCGQYLMTEPTEKEKFKMKRLCDMVLKEKLQRIQECLCSIKECEPSYHISMVSTLLEQLEEILIKRNLKRVTFDIG